MKLRVGTRGSRLARVQTDWVVDRIRALNPTVSVEVVEVVTTGDRIRDVPLGPHLGHSFFTKEIEQALLDGRIDVAVHSCKDLAATSPAGLRLSAIAAREDPRDALVSRGPALHDLPPGSRVGTSSPRRRSFLTLARPDLVLVEQRGNVPTRLRSVDDGTLDAVVLAAAGLNRLGLRDRIVQHLDPELMLPAAAQGALAVQTRTDDPEVGALVSALDRTVPRRCVTAERECLRALGAGCQAPVGALASVHDGRLRLRGAAFGERGLVRVDMARGTDDPTGLGRAVATALLERLGVASLARQPRP